jgi:hypothetical protein
MRFLLALLMAAFIALTSAIKLPIRLPIKLPTNRLQEAEVADLVFLVDITGSMQPYIDGTKEAILDIVDQLDTVEIEKLRMAFVGYRDVNDQVQFEILPFTTSPNSFRSFLARIKANGGGDGPEDVFGGLEKVGQLDWSPNAGTRVMIHIADSPCHGRKYHDGRGDHPEGDPEGRSLTQLLGLLKMQNVDYIFGRIRASRTNKMIREFSKVYGETIPQFDIIQRTTVRPRPCTHRCCKYRFPSVRPSVRCGFGGGRGSKCGTPIIARPPPDCIDFLAKWSAEGGSAPKTAAAGARGSIAEGSLFSLRRGVDRARARLGSS